MTLKEMQARLGQIVDELDVFENKADHTNEDIETINNLSVEFEDLKNKIEAKEKIANMKKSVQGSNRQAASAPTVTPKVTVSEPKLNSNAGYDNFGRFLTGVKNHYMGKGTDENLKNYMQISNTHFESSGEDGGFLIPKEFINDIQKKVQGEESLISRSRQYSISSNYLELPVDEEQPWNGGVQAYWTAEGEQYNESKKKLGTTSFKLNKLGVLVKATEELLEDASALESLIRSEAPVAITQKLNEAVIQGDGVGKPKGIINSGFAYAVAAEGGQASDTVIFENIVKMWSRLIPQSRSNAVWLIAPQVEEQLRLMAFKSGVASPVPAYMPPAGLSETPYGTLMGRPVMPMMGCMNELGTKGDIILVDMNYYYAALKGGVNGAVSTHLYFDRDITTFKFNMRVDGHCPFKSPVQDSTGYDMSGIVTLQDR